MGGDEWNMKSLGRDSMADDCSRDHFITFAKNTYMELKDSILDAWNDRE
jgi:hypothetical protein